MNYFTKRLAVTILTLFLVSLLTFAAFRLIPGDAALLALGMDATEEQIAELRTSMGLDRSFPEQYIIWLGDFLSGRLGNSSRFMGASVSSLITERLPVTFTLASFSFIFTIIIAFPFSILTVKKENSLLDKTATTFSALGISMPGFFLGVLLIWIFGIFFRLFIPGAYISYRDDAAGFFAYMIFPALAIAIPNAALVIKFLRSSLFLELKKDYVRTARSKGAKGPYILRTHALKNASLPVITLLGMIAGETFSGSIVIEQVFGIPGIGRLLITSINARDYIVVKTLVIYIAFIVVIANTLADIILQIMDPRIRLAGKA